MVGHFGPDAIRRQSAKKLRRPASEMAGPEHDLRGGRAEDFWSFVYFRYLHKAHLIFIEEQWEADANGFQTKARG
jgi:hypothetical protein